MIMKYANKKSTASVRILSLFFSCILTAGVFFTTSAYTAAEAGAGKSSAGVVVETIEKDGVKFSNDSSGFVVLSEAVPDVILEIRYHSTYNFVGDRIDGYEQPIALLTKEAADALKNVSDELIAKGYRLKIFDACRYGSAGR